MYISTNDELAAFCERAARSKVLAVDTEFLREHSYYPQLCLIQLATADESCAADPILIQDLGPLKELLLDESITKVFHACSQDLEVIWDALGVIPRPIFDTQVAAAFLGQRQQIGYGPLVEAYCGVHLAKAEALTDWSKRPLDPEQLRYAEDDVIYLPGIYEDMMSQLVERDRLSWVLPEMEELCRPEHVLHDARQAYLHLRRSSSLTRKQLAVAREVAAWREDVAAQRDVPRKWVVSDEVLVECCRRLPKTQERLRSIRGAEQLNRRDADGLLKAIAKGRACPEQDYPESRHHERPTAEAESVADLMYALLRIISKRSGIAIQLIATRDDLLDFAASKKNARLASGWRWELAGKSLAKLLEGQVGLTVKEGRVEVL